MTLESDFNRDAVISSREEGMEPSIRTTAFGGRETAFSMRSLERIFRRVREMFVRMEEVRRVE